LKIAIIKDEAIVFRCEPNDPEECSWTEKIWFDAVRTKKDWVLDANIDTHVSVWYEDNKKMENAKQYGIRLFIVNVESTDIPEESLLAFGRHVSQLLNQEPNNNTTIKVDEKNLFGNVMLCGVSLLEKKQL
jgi:hypothetical protein